MTPKKRKTTEFIVVHCSATKAKQDIGASDIDVWHKQRGWIGIGYHYVIKRDGTLELGRPVDAIGAHVKDYNERSVGICMVGGLDEEGQPDVNYTQDQWDTLDATVFMLSRMYPTAEVVGHNNLTNHKACPCFDVKDWWSQMREHG
jgi:N-acetylmuramoyl-L-alanine amidase